LSLSLGGVCKLISAPRPKVTAAERQVQLAHPPVQLRAHEPPSQPTEMWAGGCEIDFVVNLELLARTVIGHRISQAQPAVPRIAHARLEFQVYLVIIKIEPHFAGKVEASANSTPPHHVVDIKPYCLFDCGPPAASSERGRQIV